MSRTAEVFAFLKHEDEPTGALLARKLVQHAAKVDKPAAKAAAPEAGTAEAAQ
jgi:hypothetical protein